jgi:HK97 gp10 family phage protein
MADALADPSAVLASTSAEVARLAGPRTPRRTGALAASVSVRADGPSRATVRWGVPYAVFVNFGTRVMRPRPFATDALAAAEPVLQRLAGQWAADILEGT